MAVKVSTVLTGLVLMAMAGCASDPGDVGLHAPAPSTSAVAAVPSLPGSAAPRIDPTSASPTVPSGSLYRRTWYLRSVTENGRTWAPLTTRPATLTFGAAGTAETDDGDNTTEWQAVVDPTAVSWKQGMSTAAGETEPSFQVDSALGAALNGRTSWVVDGAGLVIKGAHAITLGYGAVPPAAPAHLSGLGIFLNAGHVPQPGEMDQFLAGHVQVRDAAHKVVAELDLTPYDDGETVLPPGSYEVSGTVAGGPCVSAPAVAALGGITEVTLGCPLS